MKYTKRILSLLLSLTLVLGLLPATSFASDVENVTVNIQFDCRSIATDEMMTACEISYPTSQIVTVPNGSTVYDALQQITDFTVTYNENQSMVTAFADIGDINTLCDNFGAKYDSVFQYAGWMYSVEHVDGKGIQVDKITEDSTIVFRYTVYYGANINDEWVNFDWSFVDAYYGIQDDITTAKALRENDYTAAQWNALQAAITNAETTLSTVQNADTDECLTSGLMLNYIAEKGTSLWGPGSPTEQLQTAKDNLERAINKISPAPEKVVVPAEAELQVGTPYQLVATVEPAGASQSVTYEKNAFLNADCYEISDTGLITPIKATGTGKCMVTVTSAEDSTKSANFFFKIKEAPAKPAVDMNTLLENIAAKYVDSSDPWVILEMGAYAKAFPGKSKLSDAAKQNYINVAVNQIITKKIGSYSIGDTGYDKIILALTANGIDPAQLYPVNSNTPVSAVAGLNSVAQSTSAWNAPYTLAAYQQKKDANTESYENTLIGKLLEAQKNDGSWDEYGTIDTTANVIAGLSFYAEREDVSAAIEKGVNYLAGQMKPGGVYDGGYGANANSTAMVIVGLCAAGVNPNTDSRFIKDGKSVLDGLLSFAPADHSGFGHQNNTKSDPGATEQGFRALIAASQVMSTGEAYNIYDFSANQVEPGRATGSGAVQKPAEPSGTKDITVTFALKSDVNYWVSPKSVTVKEGSTVYHVFTAALQDTGITYEGAESGYVSSITKDGRTLAEFTTGENSGWLYKVNDALPEVGLTGYEVHNGDRIVWYYTDDWTKDPQAGHYSKPDTTATTTTTKANSDGTVKVAVTQNGKELSKVDGGVKVALEIQGGTGSMAVLVDKDGKETALPKSVAENGKLYVVVPGSCTVKIVDNSRSFADVKDTDWYASAVDFAAGHGLYNGTGADAFSPKASMSRAMLATVLYRLEGTPIAAGDALTQFTDGSIVTDWAKDGMSWAVTQKILAGTDGGALAGDENITREQLAVMLVRYAKVCGLENKSTNTAAVAGQGVSAWAVDAMAWAVEMGLLKGNENGALHPQDAASRAEVAIILQRFVAVLVK